MLREQGSPLGVSLDDTTSFLPFHQPMRHIWLLAGTELVYSVHENTCYMRVSLIAGVDSSLECGTSGTGTRNWLNCYNMAYSG